MTVMVKVDGNNFNNDNSGEFCANFQSSWDDATKMT